MNSERGQSIALINVLIMVGLISLAFIMSNYGMLTIVRRLTQTGADASALAAADYLADKLRVSYVHSCPGSLNEWIKVKEELTKEGVWQYYRDEYYLKYLQSEDYNWKNQVTQYLGYHQSASFGEPILLPPVQQPFSPGLYALPEKILVVVGAKGDSPVSAPQLYGSDSIEVHAEAAAELSWSNFAFPSSETKSSYRCPQISEQKGRWRDTSKSDVRDSCNREADNWERLDDGLPYSISTQCDVDVYERVYDLKYTVYESRLTVEVTPQRTGIDVDWISKGLRLAP